MRGLKKLEDAILEIANDFEYNDYYGCYIFTVDCSNTTIEQKIDISAKLHDIRKNRYVKEIILDSDYELLEVRVFISEKLEKRLQKLLQKIEDI